MTCFPVPAGGSVARWSCSWPRLVLHVQLPRAVESISTDGGEQIAARKVYVDLSNSVHRWKAVCSAMVMIKTVLK